MKNKFYCSWQPYTCYDPVKGRDVQLRPATMTIWHPDTAIASLPYCLTAGQFDKSGRFIPTNVLDPMDSDIEQIWELSYNSGQLLFHTGHIKEYFCSQDALQKFIKDHELYEVMIDSICLMGFDESGKLVQRYKVPGYDVDDV